MSAAAIVSVVSVIAVFAFALLVTEAVAVINTVGMLYTNCASIGIIMGVSVGVAVGVAVGVGGTYSAMGAKQLTNVLLPNWLATVAAVEAKRNGFSIKTGAEAGPDAINIDSWPHE